MPGTPSNARPAPWPLVPALLALCLAWLTACGDERPDPGLITAPGFADESGRLAGAWRFAHHATTGSYRLQVSDGIASIERVGHEPWAMLVQTVPDESLRALAGRRLAFSMDIRADLEDETWGRPLQPTGLSVHTWLQTGDGQASALSAMLGPRQAETRRLALPPDARIPDWTRHTLEFPVPEDVARLEIAVVMSSGGHLQVRNPALYPLVGN